MAGERPLWVRVLLGLLGWVVVVPALSLMIALLVESIGAALIIPLVLSLVTLRWLLASVEFGFLWRLLTYACAGAIAISSIFGVKAYVVVRGERLDAVVVKRFVTDTVQQGGEMVPYRHEVDRLSDPATNRDLGGLPEREFHKAGERVPVLVVRGSDLPAVPVERAGVFTSAAAIWLVSWLIGLVLLVLRAVTLVLKGE